MLAKAIIQNIIEKMVSSRYNDNIDQLFEEDREILNHSDFLGRIDIIFCVYDISQTTPVQVYALKQILKSVLKNLINFSNQAKRLSKTLDFEKLILYAHMSFQLPEYA